jgi:hypothetical protein
MPAEPPIPPRDMSQTPGRSGNPAALRKRRQRLRLRLAGRHKLEVWVSGACLKAMAEFGDLGGKQRQQVGELVLERAAPLYLAQVSRRLDTVLPVLRRIRLFEHYGIRPSPTPAAPYRFGHGPQAVVLDPHEYHRCLEERERLRPVFEQLARLGIDPAFIEVASGAEITSVRRRQSRR